MKIKDITTFFTDTVFRKKEYDSSLAHWAVNQYKLLFYTVQGSPPTGPWCAPPP